MNFVTKVFEYMSNDDECSDKSSDKIKRSLKNMTPEQLEAVDDVLANLCGFTSDTILEMCAEEEEDEEDEEQAHEAMIDSFYGSSQSVTLKEQQDEARKLK